VPRRPALPTAPRAPWAVVADGVRLLAALSVLVGTYRAGAVAAALFLLVLGGTMVPRVVGVPPVLDALYGGTLLFAAWAAQLDWYVAVGWLDLVVHAAATGLEAVVATAALTRWGAVATGDAEHPRAAVVVVVAGLGTVGAVLWEVGEWFGHAVLDPRIQVGYTDTLGDLAAGLLGSVVAGVAVAWTDLLVRPGASGSSPR